MIPATISLLRNPTYVFNTLALACSTIIATGLGPFIVKYLQSNFGATNSKAGISVGITLIPGTAGGIFIGSVLMKRLKSSDSCQMAAKYCFVFQLFAIFSVASFLIPGCEPPRIAGVHQPYFGRYIYLFYYIIFINPTVSLRWLRLTVFPKAVIFLTTQIVALRKANLPARSTILHWIYPSMCISNETYIFAVINWVTWRHPAMLIAHVTRSSLRRSAELTKCPILHHVMRVAMQRRMSM